MKHLLFIIGIAFGMFSCNNSPESSEEEPVSSELDSILSSMYLAHGELGDYQFVFRENTYSFHFDGDEYTYTKSVVNDSINLQDTLTNNGFSRYEDGVPLKLSPEYESKFVESLNSVIYFVCLPLKLQDPAANKRYLGEVEIKAESYDIIEVYFDEEGGGKDHDDVFAYWVNQNTNQVDYLAYQYATNGGGVRFRTAYNSRMIDGMRFQDYVNYGAPVGTALVDLPELFIKGELDELSTIVSEDVISID